MAMSMMIFVRNQATNILPLILGLFLKINGTSSRVMTMLSNVGVCVSGRTVERLKRRISDDAISYAVELITSGRLFSTIFDNINIFQRKFQQRITNLNSHLRGKVGHRRRRSRSFPDVGHVSGIFVDHNRVNSLLLCLHGLEYLC